MRIIKVNNKNKKIADKFKKNEWKKFNKEKNYSWDHKEYSLIAIDNKKVVGFIKFNITGGVAYLEQLIVAKSDRQKGVGQKLLKKFEEIAKNKGCHAAYLDTSEKHNEALNFYMKNNYKISSKLKNYKFHFDWYLLSKRLK